MDLYNMRKEITNGKTIYDLPLKVTYYARVSSEKDEQLNSLSNQVFYFENHIKKFSNWTYVDGYVDEGISGTSVNKRDSFKRMIADSKKGKFDLELQAVEHEEITEFNPKAKIAVFLVLIGFALDIVAMYVFKLTGGDAAALLGGTAVLLIIIINIMNFNKKCFEQTCDNIIEGFVFGIKIFAAIIPIAAFFYMGEVAPITAVLGEVLPSGSQGLLSDMGVALSNTIPLNKFAVCSIQTVVGAITGLDGSGFSGISLVGSLANVFGTAVNGSVGALCALGQIAGIWTGGGCLVPWGLISAAAICGVSPIELAKRNLKPILIGFAVTTIVAVFII